MRALIALLVLVASFAPAAASAAGFEEEIVERHNALRARHGASPLRWSPDIAAYAEAWAEENARTNRMHHRSEHRYGENIFWVSGGPLRATTVVDAWYGEISQYNYNNPGFSMSTGHFTQVVWRGSNYIGCGRARTQSGGTYVVCNYDPPGNFEGRYRANVLPPR
ncbi:MAG TPA: CAP family protein [Reyranella sp.]|nr:CAP family protein [Reyranella sp.]